MKTDEILEESHADYLHQKMVKAIAAYMANWLLEEYRIVSTDEEEVRLKDPSKYKTTDLGTFRTELHNDMHDASRQIMNETRKKMKELLKSGQ